MKKRLFKKPQYAKLKKNENKNLIKKINHLYWEDIWMMSRIWNLNFLLERGK